MSELIRILKKIASGIDDKIDEVAESFKYRLGLSDPLQIVSYRSYGTFNRFYVKGRVLEDKGITKSVAADSLFNNLLNMYKRFESDEVPNAELKIVFQGKEHFTYSDKEGYFRFDFTTDNPVINEGLWHIVEVELLNAPAPFIKGLKSAAQVLIPPIDAEYGIISDIDDTIIKTGATNLLMMARNTFLHNANTRLPFAGVAEFYRSLQLGRNGKRNNPFFYVSSSPWNVYDLLTDFLDLNKIPAGPLLLRDFGISDNKIVGSGGHMGHKMKEIENILLSYPHLNFVLIGDSGQEDPKIYKEVVKKYPGRILAVYIRDVQVPDRQKIAIDISKELAPEKVEMIIVDNTVEAAEHAEKIGLIYKEAIPDIIEEKKMDKGEKPGKIELEDAS